MNPVESDNTNELAPLIFISHRSTDEGLAKKVRDLLMHAFHMRASEIRCTSVVGSKLPAGANSSAVLSREISACKVFIALLTKSSVESSYVLFELGARWGMNKRIFPLIGPDSDFSVLPPPIRDANALKTSVREDVQQLLSDVRRDSGWHLEDPHAYNDQLEQLLG